MKKAYLISLIAIIMTSCLQAYNIYLQYENYAQEAINDIKNIAKSSIDEELNLRLRDNYKPDSIGQQHSYFKILKKETPIPKDETLIDLKGYDVKKMKEQGLINSSQDLIQLALQDVKEKEGKPINLATLDTIFTKNLKTKFEHSITLIDKNKRVTQATGKKDIPIFWLHTEDFAISLAHPRFVRVEVYITPSQFILQSIWTLVLSVLFVLIAAICISYQSKEIQSRDRLLKNRELTVNSIIHDLKSPINSIIALMGVIKLKITDAMTKTLAEQITNKAKQLVYDIETILSTASNQRRIILNMEDVNATELTEIAKQDVDIIYKDKPHTIIIQDNTQGNNIIKADKMYLLNVIRNLIENAVKYADNGVVVNVSITRKDRTLQVSVTDNGWGIDKKDQKQIFQQFYRVPHKNGPRGHGIGLALVKYVTESHGGHIIVNSEIGKGSKFTFFIPIK